jgi:hypothetical protein
MHQKEPLCQSYDPFREHPGIYSKVFLPGKIHISLRPFHIAHDLPLINNWLNFQFAHIKEPVRDPFQYTEDYYTTLLATPNSQPLMGMIDHQPAFQADIYHAGLGPDKLLDNTTLNDNDYIMQLMMSPHTLQNLSLSTCALLACMDCFFKYPEVNRLVWMTNAGEKDFRFIAGIAELDEMNCDDGLQSYYIITKEKFAEKRPQNESAAFFNNFIFTQNQMA